MAPHSSSQYWPHIIGLCLSVLLQICVRKGTRWFRSQSRGLGVEPQELSEGESNERWTWSDFLWLEKGQTGMERGMQRVPMRNRTFNSLPPTARPLQTSSHLFFWKTRTRGEEEEKRKGMDGNKLWIMLFVRVWISVFTTKIGEKTPTHTKERAEPTTCLT